MSRGITFRATTRWIDRPLRTCRSIHVCAVCKCTIKPGDRYFYGGHRGKHAHESCVDVEAEKAARKTEQAWLNEIMLATRPRAETERCRSCPHPPHLGLCTERSGATAYACACSAQTPRSAP